MAYAAILALLFQMASTVPEAAADGPCPPAWGYAATNGPDAWGQMETAWAICDTGVRQSPIVIGNATQDQNLPALDFDDYHAVPVTIQNNGREVKVTPLERVTVTLSAGGTDVVARLVQFHFHFPNEHAGNNANAVGEIHLVHELPDKRTLAVGIPLTLGTGNTALQIVAALRPNECRSRKSENASQYVDLSLLLPATVNRYFSYEGSLTTPACTDVSWIVLSNGITLNDAQRSGLRPSTGYQNARRPQPLAGRTVRWRNP